MIHTLGRTPLDEESARLRGLYLYKTQHTSMPAAGFESTVRASQRPHTYATERAATGIVKWF
jgi:hypothetical protein